MISLVDNRKLGYSTPPDAELYKHFQTKGIYNYKFVSECVEIGYANRIGYWFRGTFEPIRFRNLSEDSRKYILDALVRIDNKYSDAELNNSTIAEICDDMDEHYFKELLHLLENLRAGFSSFTALIFTILLLSLIFGVLLPFAAYFIFSGIFQKILTEVLISLNFGLLLFFIMSLYHLIKKEITWT